MAQRPRGPARARGARGRRGKGRGPRATRGQISAARGGGRRAAGRARGGAAVGSGRRAVGSGAGRRAARGRAAAAGGGCGAAPYKKAALLYSGQTSSCMAEGRVRNHHEFGARSERRGAGGRGGVCVSVCECAEVGESGVGGGGWLA